MAFIVDLSINILGSIIYDSGKGLFNEFDKHLTQSIIDTSNYVNKTHQIEFDTRKFREMLNGGLSAKEIDKLSNKEGLIDLKLLTKELAIFGDIYLGEDQEHLIYNLSKDIIDFFFRRFEHYLLSDPKYSSKLLIKYLTFQNAKVEDKQEKILEELKELNSRFEERAQKSIESLFIFPLSEHIGFECNLRMVANDRSITIQELKIEIDAWIKDVEGAYAKGIKNMYEGHWKKAELYLLESANSMEEKIFENYMLLAHNYLENLRDSKKAIEFYEKALIVKGDNYACLLNIGMIYLFIGETNKSIQFLEKALNIEPNSVWALNNISLAYLELKEYNLAKINLDKALELDERFFLTYANLASYYGVIQKKEKAVEAYETAILLNSDDPAIHNNLGKLFAELKKYDLAIKALEKAIQLNKNYVTAFVNLGKAYGLIGDDEKAEYYYREAIKIKPAEDMTLNLDSPSLHYEAYHNLGIIFQKRSKLKEAISYYKKALDLNSKYTSSILNIGTCYRYLLNYSMAIEWFEKYINEETQNKLGYFNLACVYSLTKDYKNSFSCLNEAIKLDTFIRHFAIDYPDLLGLLSHPEYKSKIFSRI